MQQLAKRLVLGMGDIIIAVFLSFESEDKAMRKAFVMVLFTDIGAPFEADDLRNFCFQIAKGSFDLFDVVRQGGGFEFETDDVLQSFGRGRGDGDCEEGQSEESE